MGVFAKLDGLKRPPVGNEWSWGITQDLPLLTTPPAQKALQSVGFSRAGIDELAKGKPLSNAGDRKIVAVIVAAAIG